MATQSLIHARLYTRPVSQARRAPRLRLRIRTDLLVVRLVLAAGLLIPVMMVCDVLPASLPLAGIAIAMIVSGGVGWLIRLGEVA